MPGRLNAPLASHHNFVRCSERYILLLHFPGWATTAHTRGLVSFEASQTGPFSERREYRQPSESDARPVVASENCAVGFPSLEKKPSISALHDTLLLSASKAAKGHLSTSYRFLLTANLLHFLSFFIQTSSWSHCSLLRPRRRNLRQSCVCGSGMQRRSVPRPHAICKRQESTADCICTGLEHANLPLEPWMREVRWHGL